MQIEERTEKQIIHSDNKFFPLLKEYCHLGKNLYNHANYLIRQEFCQDSDNKKYLRYGEINKLCKDNTTYPDYKNMPTAQMAQQVYGAYNIGRKAQKHLKSKLKDLSNSVEWLVSSPVRLKTA